MDKDNGYSDYCTTLANMPTINLYGNQVTSTSVQINWLDTASGESSWIIQRAVYGGTFSTIRTLDGHDEGTTDTTGTRPFTPECLSATFRPMPRSPRVAPGGLVNHVPNRAGGKLGLFRRMKWCRRPIRHS
jgi:hypothetical protein